MGIKQRNVDMCSGPLFMKILKFSIPVMLTALFQHLYNAADVIVVGRYAGREALAGVGTTGSITTLIINLFLGLSVGVNVALGKAIGEKNGGKVHRIVHTAIMVSVLGGLGISLFGIVFAEQLLTLIDVPADVMPQAKIYMQIIFAGKMPALVFNFGSSVLRSKGDTKRPFYIVSISGIINVLLNLFFVIKLGMKADGVALATVISQVFTAIAVIYILYKEKDDTRLYLKKLKIYKESFSEIMKVGVPSGIQSATFSFANVIIQSSVNSFGAAAIAGSAASANIGNFFYSALNAFYQGCVTFVSQNVGAKKYERINRIIACCVIDVIIVWAIEILITVFAGEFLISVYIPDDVEAVKMGVARLSVIGCTYGLCGLMEVMSGVLRGIGYSVMSMMSSIAGVCGIRILWIFTVFKAFRTFKVLFLAFPMSWIGTVLMHTTIYLVIRRTRLKNEFYPNEISCEV